MFLPLFVLYKNCQNHGIPTQDTGPGTTFFDQAWLQISKNMASSNSS